MMALIDAAASPMTFALALSNTSLSHKLSLVINPSLTPASLCLLAKENKMKDFAALCKISATTDFKCPGLMNSTVGDGIGYFLVATMSPASIKEGPEKEKSGIVLDAKGSLVLRPYI